jgi:hypothetical protein
VRCQCKGRGDFEMDDHTVVGRAVAILDCVASAASPLPLAALTRKTGIPKPTVRRIASDLTERSNIDARGVRSALIRFTESLTAELIPQSQPNSA